MDQLFTFITSHPFLVGTFILLLALFIRNETQRGGQSVSAQQLVDLVNRENAVVLDVRDKKEFEAGHIVDAVNIPYSALESRIMELKDYKERPLVVACKMGQHSGAAGTLLRKHGFQQVSRLTGGVAEWRNQNLPVVKS
jgi:rhodanese-related sulfurtransferase